MNDRVLVLPTSFYGVYLARVCSYKIKPVRAPQSSWTAFLGRVTVLFETLKQIDGQPHIKNFALEIRQHIAASEGREFLSTFQGEPYPLDG